jgi:hypothetical protein
VKIITTQRRSKDNHLPKMEENKTKAQQVVGKLDTKHTVLKLAGREQ